MATQQVKFHSVTAEKYGKIASPDAGSLYFITDNGEIRKGSQHVTGTRVYTAVDSTNGATPLANLTILLNGSAPGANDQPKKGDILIVDQTLKAGVPASGTEGQEGYVPAVPPVIAKAAYAHNGTDWEACDGNVDASKVILTNDITMAGNYTAVGNFTKTSAGTNKNFMQGDKGTAGVSVYELIRQMLSKTLEPTKTRDAGASLSWSNYSPGTEVEAGTKVSVKYTISFSDAQFKFTGGNAQNAGCTPSYAVTGGVNATSNSGTLSWVPGKDTTPSVSAIVTYTAGGNTLKNNLDETATTQNVPGGTINVAASSPSVTTYRKNFWLAFGSDNAIDLETANLDGNDVIPGLEDVNHNPVKLDSAYIRANGNGQKPVFTSLDLEGVEFKQVLVFLPRSSSLNKKLAADTKNGLPYINAPGNNCVGGTTTPKTIVISGAGQDAGVEYCIWEIKPGSPVNGDTIKLTWA